MLWGEWFGVMWLYINILLCGDWLGEMSVIMRLLCGEWSENIMLLYGEWLGLDVRLVVVILFLDDGVWYTFEVFFRRWSESVRDCRFFFFGIGGGLLILFCCECWDISLFVEKKNYFLIVLKYYFDVLN